jgi:hypothetical protein
MNELDTLAKEIELSMSGTPKPATLLSLLRRRARLVKVEAKDNPALASLLLKQNEKWIERSRTILADIKMKMADEKSSKQRRESLQSAYDGITSAHKIFTQTG